MDPALAEGDTLTVTLQLTTHPVQPTPSLHPLTVARTSSIKDLKSRIATEWDGKPAVDGIVCVLGGRVCRDADVIGELFPVTVEEERLDPRHLYACAEQTLWRNALQEEVGFGATQAWSSAPCARATDHSLGDFGFALPKLGSSRDVSRALQPGWLGQSGVMRPPAPSPLVYMKVHDLPHRHSSDERDADKSSASAVGGQSKLEVLAAVQLESSPHVLHIIIKGSAWTAPFKTPFPPSMTSKERQRSSSSNGAQTPAITPAPTPTISVTPTPTATTPGYTPSYLTSIPATPTLIPTAASPSPVSPLASPPEASLGPTVSGYPTYLAFLSQLIPLQRALLLLNLQKAHFEYEEAIKRRRAALGWGGEVTETPRREGQAAEADVIDGEAEIDEVKNLLVECGLWGMVQEREEEAQAEIDAWATPDVAPQDEFQVVQISGMPYILHMPPGHLTLPPPPPLRHYQSLKRAEAIHHILTTMLQLLMTYQPTSPSIAYGRALLRPHSSTGAVGTHPQHDVLGGPAPRPAIPAVAGAPVARRRATLSIVINLEAVLSILVPLVLLSLKLAFLLWIFGRHASATKRLILFVMAVGWVIWEGWVMQRRRAALGAGRDRLERANRRAAAALAAGGPAPVGVPQVARRRQPPAGPREPPREPRPVAGAGAGPVPIVAPRGVVAPRIREPVSRLSPRYWLNWVAAIGLAEEARELGLVPRSIAGRPVVQPLAPPPPNRNDRAGLAAQARRRAWRTALVAIVLFFGTLSPEVEKKRKRALEKRERLLAARRVARARKAAILAAAAAEGVTGSGAATPVGGAAPQPRGLEALRGLGAAQGTGSGASTPGVFEAEDRSMVLPDVPTDTLIPTPEAGPSNSTMPPVDDDTTPTIDSVSDPLANLNTSPPTPTTPGPATLAGREVVTDADLFADGLGEPDQLADPEHDLAEQVRQDHEAAVAEGNVEDTETDEEDEAAREAEEGEAEGDVDQIVALF
ncbi:hypothetical protein P7C70_g172, partial [Phenoliferia sp. Uapishka_3]